MFTLHDHQLDLTITCETADEFVNAMYAHHHLYAQDIQCDQQPLDPHIIIKDGSINPAPTAYSDQIAAHTHAAESDPFVDATEHPDNCFTHLNVATCDALWPDPVNQRAAQDSASVPQQPWPSFTGWVTPGEPAQGNAQSIPQVGETYSIHKSPQANQGTYPPRPSFDYVWIESADGTGRWVNGGTPEPTNYIAQEQTKQDQADHSVRVKELVKVLEQMRCERNEAHEQLRQLSVKYQGVTNQWNLECKHRDILEGRLNDFFKLARKHGWSGDNDEYSNMLEAMTYWLDSFVVVTRDKLELQKNHGMTRDALQKVSAERTALHEELDQAHKNLNGAQARIDEWVQGYDQMRQRLGHLGNRLGEERKKNQLLRDEISRLKNPHYQAQLNAQKQALRDDMMGAMLYEPKTNGFDPMRAKYGSLESTFTK